MVQPASDASATDTSDAQGRLLLDAMEYQRRLAKALALPAIAARLEIKGTPHDVILRENQVRVLHYHPIAKRTHPVPVLLVYALINKPYILDLKPERSVVRSLLVKGFDVYLIDWGEPTPDDRYVGLCDYVEGYIDRAVMAVAKASMTDSVTLLGYCMGGTLSIMYAAMHPERVRNLVVMAAPYDFEHDGGLLRFWADKRYFDVDKVVDALGNVPASFLNAGFALLDPYNNLYGKYEKMVDSVEDEDAVDLFLRMEKWIADGVDVAGETYREFIKYGYQENLLVKGQWKMGGHRVDPARIDMPLCVIVADYDTLVPKASTLPLIDTASSKDVKVLSLPKGHIGLSVSSEAHRALWPKVAEWLAPRSGLAAPMGEGAGKRESHPAAPEEGKGTKGTKGNKRTNGAGGRKRAKGAKGA